MSSNTQYQAVPTTTTTKTWAERCGGPLASPSVMLVALSLISGIAIIFFNGLEYNRVNSFSTQPSYCRVNAIGRHGKLGFKGVRSDYVDWNVDIVKQPQDNSTTELLVVLRPNLTTLALYDPERQYSVNKIYPCYVHKRLLDGSANDNKKINLQFAFQWEKPSKTTSIFWLSAGSSCIILAIICALMGSCCFIYGH